MPGPGRAFLLSTPVCTPETLLLYEPPAFPWSSPFYTSGTITASHMQFPPHLTEQENHNLPHSPLQTTSPLFPILHIRHDNGLPHTIPSSSDRTGKPQPTPQPSPDHIPPFPHPTHQEITKLPYTALYATSPFSPSYTSGEKSPSHTLLPPHL